MGVSPKCQTFPRFFAASIRTLTMQPLSPLPTSSFSSLSRRLPSSQLFAFSFFATQWNVPRVPWPQTLRFPRDRRKLTPLSAQAINPHTLPAPVTPPGVLSNAHSFLIASFYADRSFVTRSLFNTIPAFYLFLAVFVFDEHRLYAFISDGALQTLNLVSWAHPLSSHLQPLLFHRP